MPDPEPLRWWSPAVRGALAIIFGTAAFAVPIQTLAILTVFYGAFALVDGAMAIGFALSPTVRRRIPGWLLVLEGVFGLAAGIVALSWPGITLVALVYLVAAWAIVRGAFEIVAAARLRRVIRHEWFLAGAGLLSVVAGLLIGWDPVVGAFAVAWMIGLYAIAFGFALIAFAARLRAHGRGGAPPAVRA